MSNPLLYLAHVEVCISGEVLTDRGLGIAQSTVKGGATHTDHYSDQTKQEEKQTGVSTANFYQQKKNRDRELGARYTAVD